jgi:hypothetical protein
MCTAVFLVPVQNVVETCKLSYILGNFGLVSVKIGERNRLKASDTIDRVLVDLPKICQLWNFLCGGMTVNDAVKSM